MHVEMHVTQKGCVSESFSSVSMSHPSLLISGHSVTVAGIMLQLS